MRKYSVKKRHIFLLLISIGIALGYFVLNSNRPILNNNTPHIASPSATIAPTITVVSQANGACHARYIDANDVQEVLPDSHCTSGSINENVNQDNIQNTICKSGYSQTIRPSASYTNKLKEEQIQEYGYTDTNMKDYEEDHLISLELGGNPTDPKNLWPEPHSSPNEKDKLENYLHKQVCNGIITLNEAQKEISTNWGQAYKRMMNQTQ